MYQASCAVHHGPSQVVRSAFVPAMSIVATVVWRPEQGEHVVHLEAAYCWEQSPHCEMAIVGLSSVQMNQW